MRIAHMTASDTRMNTLEGRAFYQSNTQIRVLAPLAKSNLCGNLNLLPLSDIVFV